MSGRMLVRIAAALAILIFAWGALALFRSGSSDTPGGLTLPKIATAELAGVATRQGPDTVVVVRAGAGWQVNGLPASPVAVERFLSALNDSAASDELVAESAQSHERLAVDTLHGRRFTVRAGDRSPIDLWIGRRGPDFDGFYVRRVGEDRVYLLRGAFMEQTGLTLEQWRDLQVVLMPIESIGRIEVRRGKVSWALSRDAGGYTLDRGAVDSTRARRLFEQVATLRATGFPDTRQPPPSFVPPDRTLRILGPAGQPLVQLDIDSTESGAFWVRRGTDSLVFKLDARVAELISPLAEALQ